MSIGPEHGSARASDPVTAKKAAARVRPGTQRYALLRAHSEMPTGLTDEEAAYRADLGLASEYATRCSELRNDGLIEDTGETRPGANGIERMVRRITLWGVIVLGDVGKEPDTLPDPDMPDPPSWVDEVEPMTQPTPAPAVYAACTKCGTREPVEMLRSKYGPAQPMGMIREQRLWEARCATCDSGAPKRGLQSIWKETP